jgi:hypothetical protein
MQSIQEILEVKKEKLVSNKVKKKTFQKIKFWGKYLVSLLFIV